MSMEEYTGRERSPPPDPAGSAAAEIPVPNSPTPTGRTFQDDFNSPQMPASPTGGQGLTQEALIEVLRNQHQNIVQQQNLIAGQGAQISELTKLVSGLVQMQTDVLKDQAQREADERERKAEEERKAAEEAATSNTPRAGSLFTSAPKKSDSKYSGSSGGKMESYIPNCPQLEIKDSGRRHEINTWLSFRERFGSWLCLLDECYAAELQEAVKQTTTIEQGKLAPEAAVRSSKLYHWMKQAMSGYKRGLDLAVLQEREQGGLTCGYELFRRINNLLGVTTRAEALSLREAVMRLDVNGLKQLGCPSAGSIKNPLDTCLFLTQEFARLRDQCAAFADLQMMEVDQIMVMMRCLPQEIHRRLAFHGKSSTLRELMESLEFYEQQSKALDFSRDSHKGNPVGYDRPPKGSPKGGKDRTPKGEGKGKEIRCRRCGKPGHVEKDCWSKSPKRTDKDKGKGKGNEKGGKPKGGKDRSHSPYDSKKKGNPKGGKPKGGKGEPKGGKGPKGGKPKGARASVGEEDEEDILGMGCVLDMTVPPDVLLNQLHSYGNRLTTSSVADADATDPHFLVDSGASIHLISQSLVDEGYLQICREWAVNERCTTANGQEMILNRCVEAEFSTHALKSRHVSFIDCDGAAASSPCAASPVAASSRAAAPSPAAPASSSLSPVSRSICAGSQLQRPQKLRVTGLIGYGQVSLLSVALLASKGWTFSCSPGKSCSRTSREVDKPAKPPCLSLSHFGGHDQVPNRTKSSRTHLDIFLWCNVPCISIVHPGVIDIDMSSSLHSLHYTSDVEPSAHRVVRYSTMHEAVQDSVLHVAEREGSSSVHERIDCADPGQPRFRRVEHAFGRLGRYHGVERREEERAESGHGHGRADRTSARHCDRSSRATGCGRGAIGTEGRDAESCPCHDGTRGEYRSDRETSRTGTREEHRSYREAFRDSKGKGIGDGEARVRRSKGSSRARDPREAFRRDGESSGGNVRAGSDVSDESLVKLASSARPERRREANQKSSQAASAETAAPVGSDCRPSASSSKRTISPTSLDCVKGRPRAERVDQESVETAEGADCEIAIGRTRSPGLPGYREGRVHGAGPPQGVGSAQASATSIRIPRTREGDQGICGIPTFRSARDLAGQPDRLGNLRRRGPGRDSRSSSREHSDTYQRSKERFDWPHERITSETIVRIHADAQGGVSTRRQDIKPGTAYYMKRKPEEPGNVKYTSQVRAIWRPSSNAAVSIEAASISGSEAGHQVLTLTEENLRLHETTRRAPRPTPSLLPMKAKAKPVGPQPPPGPPPGWKDPAVDGPEEAASPAVAKPKEPASPVSVDPEKMLAVIAQTGVPEPKTPPVPGPKTPPTPTTRPKAKSRPLTEEQKAVADEVLAQKARDLLKAADLKRGTGTLEEEKPPTASGSGAKRVPKYLAHLTDEEREKLFRSELASERQAGAIEWEKELNRQAKEEEERRKAKALYRSERMAQALEHGKEVQRRRQEEFEKGKQDLLQWRAEEEDRENLRKARRISLEQPAVPPKAGGVVLTPAPKAMSEPTVMMGESPATPPEALQAPLSEEEIAYRKQLQEHLSKFSDKREDAK